LIRLIIDKSLGKRMTGVDGQRGGIAILTALGFLLFSVPLITASLDVAQATAIDARVKSEITHRQYCGLAVQEYINYLVLDESRWADWQSDNLDPSDPTGTTSKETIAPCGKTVTITAAKQSVIPTDSTTDSIGNPIGYIPLTSAYSNRDFHTSKTVSDSNPTGGASVTYTITVVNRDSTNTTLNEIEEELPDGFSYDCDGPPDQLTLPGASPVDIVPNDFDDECEDGEDEIEWDMPPGTSIAPGGVVTLTFTAITSTNPGTYCNEFQVTPGGDKTRSGKTAIVQIGEVSGLCSGEAATVAKTVGTVAYVSTDTSSSSYVYSFNVDYSITVTNIGEDDLEIKGFVDLLPQGFSYVSTSPSGDITEVPSQLHQVSGIDRQRVTWNFNPDVSLDSGESKTLTYTTSASVGRGDYWSDLLVDFEGGSFSEDKYSWPTARFSVKDIYTVTAADDEGNIQVIAAQVWVADDSGVINTWTLQ